MIDYKYADLFLKDNVDKQFLITTDDESIKITNNELHLESFELNESICSENTLRFGASEASSVRFRISNVFTSLKGKWITVSVTLDGNNDEPFVFGRYKVDSDKPTADRSFRDIVAYDAMYDILNADVTEWYNGLGFPMSLKTFRNAFISHFNLQEEQIDLPNDEMVLNRNSEITELSGKTVVTAICEINGCFGHVSGNIFKYVFLKPIVDGLYPSTTLYPSVNLYPREEVGTLISKSTYIPPCKYEDYVVKTISGITLVDTGNNNKSEFGTSTNMYIIQNNFLLYNYTSAQLKTFAENLLAKVDRVSYRPFSTKAKGNPCLEVGDVVRLNTKNQIIESYILQRTLIGIQSLKDNYDTKGAEYYTEKLNSINRAVSNLSTQTNQKFKVVGETIDNVIESVSDLGESTSTRFLQTNELIALEAERATAAEGNLQSSYTQLANEIVLKVDANGNLVTVELSADASLGSSFTVSADNIDLSGKTINLTSDNISIESTNFSVDKNGNVKAVNGEFSGIVTCGVGSSLGGFKTDSNSLFKGSWGSSTPDVFMCTGSTGSYTLGGHTDSGWVFGAGSNFGVTSSGSVYCSDLNASGGTIGGLTIAEAALLAGDSYINYNGNTKFVTLYLTSGATTEGNITCRGYGYFDEIWITGSQDFYDGWSITACIADLYNKINALT